MNAPLRVAVVHYHLRPGGVTSVIERSVRSLATRDVRCVVLCGETPATAPHVRIVDGLAYAERGDGSALKDALLSAATGALGGPPDLWHIHNHSVGKNPSLNRAVLELARDGARLLLQIHDFAEDGRSENYRRLVRDIGDGQESALAGRLYPDGPFVHFATLTTRDRQFLMEAGARPERVHHLPNPVVLEGEAGTYTKHDVFTYPTRAIRRKNLGEFLLWAAQSPPGSRWQVTLAPRSPEDRPAYERWIAVARDMRLPVDFEVGVRTPRPILDVVASSRAIVTTSMVEGFGLSFLEPWLARRPVLGRDLPEITDDFRAAGLRLDHLYARLPVPLVWLGPGRVRRRLADHYRHLREAYGRACAEPLARKVARALTADEHIDFGQLDESMQEEVLARLAHDPSQYSRLAPGPLAQTAPDAARIEHNRACVERAYNLAVYGDGLMKIYGAVMTAPEASGPAPSSAALVDAFLAPHRLSLLRS